MMSSETLRYPGIRFFFDFLVDFSRLTTISIAIVAKKN